VPAGPFVARKKAAQIDIIKKEKFEKKLNVGPKFEKS
jgi:hypothetical protein